MRSLARAFALFGAIPIILFAAFGIASGASGLSDPCVVWGMESGGALSPGEPPCEEGMTGTSETKGEAALRLILLHGSLLAAASMAVIAAWTIRRWISLGATSFLFSLSFPLMTGSLGAVTLLACAAFVASVREMPPLSRRQDLAVGILGSLAALGVLWALIEVIMMTSEGGFALLQLPFFRLPFLLIVLAAFAPDGRQTESHRANAS